MTDRVLVVIPAYNEALNIERVVGEVIENYPMYDYVIINDGSTDNTARICRRNGWKIIDLPMNLGLAGAFQTGLKYAHRKAMVMPYSLTETDSTGRNSSFQ